MGASMAKTSIKGVVVTAVFSAVMTAVLIFLIQGVLQIQSLSEKDVLLREKTELLERQQNDIDAAEATVRQVNEELQGKIDSLSKTIAEQKAEIDDLRARTEQQQTLIAEAQDSGLIPGGE